jgi:phosphoethanolamine N-methyltransferase
VRLVEDKGVCPVSQPPDNNDTNLDSNQDPKHIADRAAHSQYNETFIAALQWLWGDGNLAPGGTDDLAVMLGGINTQGKRILDIGSGLGAIAVELAANYGAARVTGIDVEPHLVAHSRERAAKAGVADRVSFETVTPGPLPFADASFDIVVTKDAIIHIPDKAAFYQDVRRVLQPGGVFAGSDWLRGGSGDYSETARQWLEIVHLDFEMQNLEQTTEALQRSGFEQVRLNDRNAWYQQEIKHELATLEGDKYHALAELIGAEAAQHRLHSSRLKQQVVNEGFLRPTHFSAVKPAR